MFPSTTLNANITKLFCGLHSMLLLLPTVTILEWPPAATLEVSVTSQKIRGKLCHLISIQPTHLMSEFSVSFLLRHCIHTSLQYGRRWLQFPNNTRELKIRLLRRRFFRCVASCKKKCCIRFLNTNPRYLQRRYLEAWISITPTPIGLQWRWCITRSLFVSC